MVPGTISGTTGELEIVPGTIYGPALRYAWPMGSTAMDLAQADLVLRTAAVALAWAAVAIVFARRGPAALRLCAGLAIGGIAAFMIASAPGAMRVFGLASFVLNAWCLATPVFVWT